MSLDAAAWTGTSTDVIEQAATRVRADWTRLRGDLDALVAHEGIALEPSSYGDYLQHRRDSFTDGGAFTGGARPTRWFLGYETLTAFQNIGMIEHLLLPSARSHRLTGLLLEARDAIASQLAMLLDAEQHAFGACGAGGATPRSTCALGEVCAPPAFAACTDSQIRSILSTQLAFTHRIADVILRFGFDANVIATAAQVSSNGVRLDALVRGAGGPDVGQPEEDFSAVIERTAVFEISRWLIGDQPDLGRDLGFLRDELLDRFQMLGLIDHLLLPSTDSRSLAAALNDVRDTSAAEVRLLMTDDDALEGKCGGSPPPPASLDAGCETCVPDAGVPDADASTCPLPAP